MNNTNTVPTTDYSALALAMRYNEVTVVTPDGQKLSLDVFSEWDALMEVRVTYGKYGRTKFVLATRFVSDIATYLETLFSDESV